VVRRIRINSGRLHCVTCGATLPIGAIESHRCPSRELMICDAMQALAEDKKSEALKILSDLRKRLVADGFS